MDGLVMSAETCGGIRLLVEDFSLALVVVVAAAFNGSQSRRPCCGVTAAVIKVGSAAVFRFQANFWFLFPLS